jgi:hypothetical protein
MMPIAQVALEVELVIGEDRRELQGEQAGKTEPEGERREMAGGAPGTRRTDRIGSPCHRMELQAKARQPGREAPARALHRRQCAMAQRQTFVSRLLDPLCATFGARGFDWAEDGTAHRFHATEAQGRAADSVQPRCAIDPAIDPWRRVHRRQKMCGLADKKLVPALTVFAVGEGEARHEDTIEKAFQAGGHRAPPGGEHEDEMLGPGHELHGIRDAGFQGLVARRRHQDIRLKIEIGERVPTHLGASVPRARRVGICQGLAEAAAAGMTQHDKNFRRPRSALGTDGPFGSGWLEHR